MAMMDALVRYGREPEAYAIREMPIPVIGPDEVLVEVAYASICGTDAVTFRNEDHGFVDPLIQGHELSGIIVAVGDHVVGWSLGDRVAPESSARLCGTCPMCLTGRRATYVPSSNASATASTVFSPVMPSAIGELCTVCPKAWPCARQPWPDFCACPTGLPPQTVTLGRAERSYEWQSHTVTARTWTWMP